jgi:hypothetical protein
MVFISYSQDNQPIVTRLCDLLRQAGATIWIDHERLTPGTADWEEAIRTGITRADALVFVASPQARQSRYVRDEIGIAREQHKSVFPIWIVGTEWYDSVPLGWGSMQYADARGNRFETGVHELIRSLGLKSGGDSGYPAAAIRPTTVCSTKSSHAFRGYAPQRCEEL